MLDNHYELVQSRGKYAYPPLSLRFCDPENAPDAVLWGQPVAICGPSQMDGPQFAGYSSFKLDEYHRGLLNSSNSSEVLLGVASVTFWGFAQGRGGRHTTNRALGRARNVAGQGKRGGDAEHIIIEAVGRILSLIEDGRRQEAILEAMTLKHHGLAFGSKLLAFCAPESECVYDEVISLRLEKDSDPRLRQLHVATRGQHNLAAKSSAYAGWAALCTAKAEELNLKGMMWRDWDGSERIWRAIDVERAFFALGRD